MPTAFPKPPAVPAGLWAVIPETERQEIAQQDGGFRAWVGAGPWKCNYFTTWNHAGEPLATYDKTENGWIKTVTHNPKAKP